MTFTPTELEQLRAATIEASEKGLTQFGFHGNILLTAYAEYVIRHLDKKFKENIPIVPDTVERGYTEHPEIMKEIMGEDYDELE